MVLFLMAFPLTLVFKKFRFSQILLLLFLSLFLVAFSGLVIGNLLLFYVFWFNYYWIFQMELEE